jgi:hypothetical protein
MRNEVEVYSQNPVEMSSRADVDIQIVTAKKYPRDPATAGRNMVKMATIDETVAAQCFYSLPRGGKEIRGPSVRLAEIALSSWGNCRVSSGIIATEPNFVVAEAVGWDLESNVGVKTQCRRRITDKYGKRYNDDMIGVTSNAACAVAMREAIFKLVPRTMVNRAYDSARNIAVGDVSKLPSRIESMFERFGKIGVEPDKILASLGKKDRQEISLGDIEYLIGVYNGIMDGEITATEVFKPKALVEDATDPQPKNEVETPAPEPAAPVEQAPRMPAEAPESPVKPAPAKWQAKYQTKALAAYKAIGADAVANIRNEVEAKFGTMDDWEDEAFEAAYLALDKAISVAKKK